MNLFCFSSSKRNSTDSMAKGTSNDGASASIVCDPTNYDWIDDGSGKLLLPSPNSRTPDSLWSLSGTAASEFGNVNAPLNGRDFARASPNVNMTPNRNSKATDKDVNDFINGESANQTLMRLSNQFAPIVENDADTLIYIGTPPQTRNQTDHEYGYIQRQFQRPYLLRSETLRKLDSEKFKELLGPKSKRVQRKLQKAGVHKLILEPEKIKYFIDLSPDIHDDEGMILLTELSAPSGARSWHKVAHRFNIKPSHVCGRDTLDVPPKPIYRPTSRDEPESEDRNLAKKRKPSTSFPRKDSDTSQEEQEPQKNIEIKTKEDEYDLPEEDDYSQLRHYTAIARLLHAITGHDPKLNSAPKAWTFCMLAKFFDCAKHNIINRWVTDWLVQSGNLNFIQINPSTAYRLGMAMEAVWLVRTSFCIMVGQKAFTNAAVDVKDSAPLELKSASLVTDGLDDDDINRVDHAAAALAQRVKGQWYRLISEAGEWKNCCEPRSQMARLYQLDFPDPEAQHALEEAKTSLDRYIRRLLCTALVEFDGAHGKYENMLKPPMNITSYYLVPALLRPLTMQFWEALKKETFNTDHVRVGGTSNHKHWDRILRLLRSEGALAAEIADIPYVAKTDLSGAVDEVNAMQYRSEGAESTSPKKKVKLSPPSKSRNVVGPATLEEVFQSNENYVPAKPSTFLRMHSAQHNEDEEKVPLLREEARESDVELLNEKIGSVGSHNVQDTDDDDWEDVLGHLESRPVPDEAVHVEPLPGLPIRTKPAVSEISPSQAFGEFSRGDARTQLPYRQSIFTERFSEAGTNIRTKPRYPPAVRESAKYRISASSRPSISYGNPEKPHPSSSSGGSNVPQQSLGQTRVNFSQQHVPFDDDDVLIDARQFDSNARPNSVPARNYDPAGIVPLPAGYKDAIAGSWTAAASEAEAHLSKLRVTNPDVDQWPSVPKDSPTWPPRRSVSSSPEPDEQIIFTGLLLSQIQRHVGSLVTPILCPGFTTDGYCAYDVPVNELGTLTCLTEDEYRYLPLWAGGNDDGSGGVFDDGEEIPEAPEVEYGGFRGGAIGIIKGVGSTIGGSQAGSEFEEIMTEVGVSTVGKASRIATDGEDTVMSLDD